MLERLKSIAPYIGNTPIWELSVEGISLFAKLEYYNFTGSIKDRSAYNIILNAIIRGEITEDSTVIESSSGNFAISLAMICARLNIRFISVIDPVINKNSERLLNLICHKVIKVSKQDKTGGYLLTRLETVKSICKETPGAFWTNQYQNPDNYLSYKVLGDEIGCQFSSLEYAFIGVSTCGTITGLSIRLKELFPQIRIIAVDVLGSVIFGNSPQKRYISGIGASITSPLLKNAMIDEIVYVSQLEIIDGCEELLTKQLVFGGASSGAAYIAVKNYFRECKLNNKPKVLFLCTDKGTSYLESVYDAGWKKWLAENLEKTNSAGNYAIHK